jgi:hypothetical protein
MMNNLLYEINSAIAQLTESLADGEIDEQAYADTIESLGASEAIEDIVKSIRNLEAEAEQLNVEKMLIDSKKKRAEETASSLKKVLINYMALTKSDKVEAGVFKITKGSTQSVELLYEDIENYPEEYLVEQKPKLDKRKLLSDLKEGCIIDGAIIKTTDYIKIK